MVEVEEAGETGVEVEVSAGTEVEVGAGAGVLRGRREREERRMLRWTKLEVQRWWEHRHQGESSSTVPQDILRATALHSTTIAAKFSDLAIRPDFHTADANHMLADLLPLLWVCAILLLSLKEVS